MIKFGYRRHCGGLDESLRTVKYITMEKFNQLLPEYEFYAYDVRCKQYLFILKHMEDRINCFVDRNWDNNIARCWLFIEVQ